MILLDPRNLANPDVPNIGLAYAATHLRAPVVDQHIMPEPRDRVLEMPTDVLGISVRAIGRSEAERLRQAYLQRYPSARVASVTSCLDIQCCYPFHEFAETITCDLSFGDELPFPDWDLFDSITVLRARWQTGEWSYPIMTSTGCPFGCSYCAARRTRWQARSPEHCAAELREAVERWGIRRFQVMDDCFNVDRDRALAFCEAVAPLGLPWGCANGLRADRFDEQLAIALSDAGCHHVAFGIESTDPAVLAGIDKGETLEQIEQAVAVARRHLGVAGFFILGLPGSSYASDLQSIRWALRQGITGHFSFYVPQADSISDQPFYGPGARPLSDAYPAHLQQRLYDLTACWRGGEPVRRFAYLRLLWAVDKPRFLRVVVGKLAGRLGPRR